MLSKNTKWETLYLKASLNSYHLNFKYKMKVMNLLHYTENTIDTRQNRIYFCELPRNNTCIVLCWRGFAGNLTEIRFWPWVLRRFHQLRLVLVYFYACSAFTWWSISYKLPKKSKTHKETLNAAILDRLCRFLNRLY